MKSPDSSGTHWNLHMASWHGWNYREWQQTPRGGAGAWSHASKCCWTNPISSLTGFLLMTFPILTAADQNNTYLFMHASRNHMWETEVHSRKRQTDITQCMVTLSFWAVCTHLRVVCCNWIVFLSCNMLGSLEKNRHRQARHWLLSIKLQYDLLKYYLVVNSGYI